MPRNVWQLYCSLRRICTLEELPRLEGSVSLNPLRRLRKLDTMAVVYAPCYIRSTLDALIILQGVTTGVLGAVIRRLNPQELQEHVRSGPPLPSSCLIFRS